MENQHHFRVILSPPRLDYPLINNMHPYRGSGWDFAKSFHLALKSSIGYNFGRVSKENKTAADDDKESTFEEYPLINCMCHSQSTLFAIAALYSSEGKESTRKLPIIRGSDDFWPEDSASHGPHLYANAMNSLLFTHIGVHDW